jgi:hypothetical protein
VKTALECYIFFLAESLVDIVIRLLLASGKFTLHYTKGRMK